LFGSFDLSHAKPLQNKKLERKLSAYIDIEPYIGHHCLATLSMDGCLESSISRRAHDFWL